MIDFEMFLAVAKTSLFVNFFFYFVEVLTGIEHFELFAILSL